MVKGALFVCLGIMTILGSSLLCYCCCFKGNICRSPIAEAVFSHILNERGIDGQWKVDSAAIGGWHVGNSPDSRASKTLANHNVPYNGRARQVNYDNNIYIGI